MLISNSERQARAKRDEDIEALRTATTRAELALVRAENDLLRQEKSCYSRPENCSFASRQAGRHAPLNRRLCETHEVRPACASTDEAIDAETKTECSAGSSRKHSSKGSGGQ